MPTTDPRLTPRLSAHGQEHLLDGLETLDEPARRSYLARLAEIDWDELDHPPEPPVPDEARPADVLTVAERSEREGELRAVGDAEYRVGRVAVLMVAGGQGTRLGFDGPKGCLALAPHSGKSIYRLQAEKVLSLSRRTGRAVPFLVMTSPMTDAETRAFFAEHGDFGLAPGQVRFFVQGTVPSVDRDGRALLVAPGELLENPDGHGGCFTALVASGRLEELRAGGIAHVVYVQVDNVLAPVDDPVLVGLAATERADVVTKVLEKSHPDEKVGHLVRVGDRDRVVEYTELTPEDTRAVTPDGDLVYRWGSPAMHCWSVGFLSRLAARGYRLPLHRSAKPLQAWLDGETRRVDGWKYERFIFDLIPQAVRSIGLEVDRAAEFAPIKNAEGENSPAEAVALMHAQFVSWLEAAGVTVDLPPGARVEISPLLAATKRQFLDAWDGRLERVDADCYLEV